jgi:O-antigen ligase
MGLCLIAAVEVVLLMVFGVGRAQWGGRLGGFTNPIFLGMFTCSMSVLCAYLAAGNGRARLSMALWLAALAFLTATLMTQSRGVAIAYLLLVPLLLYFLVRNRLGSVPLGVTLLVALVLILSWAATSETTRDRFYETQQEVGLLSKQENSDQTYLTSMGFRILLWRFSLAVAAEHPLFGVGDERFQQLKKAWSASGRFPAILSEHQPTTHAHNQYLQELAMRGVVGLAALLTLLIAPAVKGVRLMRSGRIGQARCGALLLSLTLAFAVFSLTEVALKHPEKIILFVVVGFIALRLSQERQPVIDDHADEHRRGGCG